MPVRCTSNRKLDHFCFFLKKFDRTELQYKPYKIYLADEDDEFCSINQFLNQEQNKIEILKKLIQEP